MEDGGELTHGSACRRARVEQASPPARPSGSQRREERNPQQWRPRPRAPPARRGRLGCGRDGEGNLAVDDGEVLLYTPNSLRHLIDRVARGEVGDMEAT